MSVDFLATEQKAQYGQYSCEPNEVQLSRYFHLDESDLAFMGKFQQRYVMRHSLFASFFTLPLLQVLVLAFEYLPYLAVFPLRNRILPAN